jgi:alkylated DNA repair dioxygenase AlkB
VDATRLSDTIGKRHFRTIIFQFPNGASRDPRYGQKPNHVLVARFLKSARNHLKPSGLVIVSTVDSPFYEGAFKWTMRHAKQALRLRTSTLSTPKTTQDIPTKTPPTRSPPPMARPPSQLSFFPHEWPDGLIYLENYIQEGEADQLVQEIDAAPWRTDLKRRVQHYGYRYDYKARQARREDYLGPLPDLFRQLAERLTAEGHFQADPDQVIINEYLPGQGISAHIDCQPCFGETIASLSLLSACVMRFTSQRSSRHTELLLQPKGLLVMAGEARHEWTHAIPARKTDLIEGQKSQRTRRISLTFRQMSFEN